MFGNVKNEAGVLFNKKNFKLVKKILKKNEKIAKHNNENKEIVFIVLKGKMEIFLNDTEKHILVPGNILQFDGINFINGSALEDSEISVILVKKWFYWHKYCIFFKTKNTIFIDFINIVKCIKFMT